MSITNGHESILDGIARPAPSLRDHARKSIALSRASSRRTPRRVRGAASPTTSTGRAGTARTEVRRHPRWTRSARSTRSSTARQRPGRSRSARRCPPGPRRDARHRKLARCRRAGGPTSGGRTLGVHPKIVSERLGHKSVEITLNTYSHVLDTMQKPAVEAMERLLASYSAG